MKFVKRGNLFLKMPLYFRNFHQAKWTGVLRWLGLTVLVVAFLPACVGKKQPLESYSESQRSKISEKSAYIQADFDFWAALYEPTLEDLEGLRAAWIEHGQAFPESHAFSEVEREVHKGSQKVVLIALFMSSYENADLLNKSLGWSVSPVPNRVTEISESDLVIRQLFPVKNQWARYFLLRYTPDILQSAQTMIVSNATSRVELKRVR